MPPESPPDHTAAPSKNVNYLGDALSLFGNRKGLAVPIPPPDPGSWENWLFLDTRDEFRLGEDWRLNYSGRLNFRSSDSIPFPTHENVRNDLRELFVEWQPTEAIWFELGRDPISVTALHLGFNPTDFFRSRMPRIETAHC